VGIAGIQMANEPAADGIIRIWRPRWLPGIELLRWSGRPPRWRGVGEGYLFGLQLRGVTELRYRNHTWSSRRGMLHVVEPRAPYAAVGQDDDPAMLVLELHPAGLETVGWHRWPPRFRAGAFTPPPDHLHALLRFYGAVAGWASPPTREDALCDFLRGIAGAYEAAPAPPRASRAEAATRRAQELLHERAAERLSLDELSAAVHMSKYHLLRCFKARFGVPPCEYQAMLRVSRARSLLAQGVPGVEVARRAGFNDQSHLNRWFKRHYGLTSSQYALADRGEPLPAPPEAPR
jgi:AraC-like DNA-binding protein